MTQLMSEETLSVLTALLAIMTTGTAVAPEALAAPAASAALIGNKGTGRGPVPH